MKNDMKSIVILGSCFLLWLAGCTPDHGNYDYTKLNEVSIDSIHEEYTVNRFSNLKIEPELKFSLGENADFHYLWYMYQNTSDKIDTLSHDRNLDKKVSLLPGTYALVYKVFDTDMEVYYYKRTEVTVKDVLSEGILILGMVNDSAEISMVNTEGVVSTQIHKGFTGRHLGIKPESIWHFIPSNSGNYLGQEYVTVVYDGGKAALFDPLNFVKVMDEKKMFVVDPGTIKIEGYHPGYRGADYLINNGKLHHRWYYLEYNIAVSGDYYLSTVPVGKYNPSSWVDLIAFYDEKGQRFVTMNSTDATSMTEMLVHKSPNPPFQPGNVGLDIKYVYNSGDGWCKGIFTDRDTRELYYLQFQLMQTQGITKMKPQGKTAIPGTAKLNQAVSMLMSSVDDGNLIFAIGGEIWVYNLASGEETRVIDFNKEGKDFEIVKLMLHGEELIVALNDKNATAEGGSIRMLNVSTLGGSIVLSEKPDGAFDKLADKVVDIAYKFMN